MTGEASVKFEIAFISMSTASPFTLLVGCQSCFDFMPYNKLYENKKTTSRPENPNSNEDPEDGPPLQDLYGVPIGPYGNYYSNYIQQ